MGKKMSMKKFEGTKYDKIVDKAGMKVVDEVKKKMGKKEKELKTKKK